MNNRDYLFIYTGYSQSPIYRPLFGGDGIQRVRFMESMLFAP